MNVSRRILVALWVSAALAAGLLATGTIPSPFAGSRGEAPPSPEAPGELGADGRPLPKGLEAAGRRPGGTGAEALPEPAARAAADVEPVIPAEVSGTAPQGGGAIVRGRVLVGATKSPVEGATVRLLRPDSLFAYVRARKEGRQDDLVARTDAEGRFTFRNVLPSNGYALLARRGTAAGATKHKIDLGARETFDAGELVLGVGGGLGGHVTGPDGKPLPGVKVAVTWQVKNDFGVVLADAKTLPWVEGTAVSDDGGVWAVPGLEAGDKTVVFEAPSGAADVKAPITVTAGVQRTDVDLAMTGTSEIAGTVVWSDGTPIAGARVFVKPTSGSAGRTHDTPADGTFRIGGLPSGTYVGGCLVEGLPVKMVQAIEAGKADLKFEFPKAGSLVGRVVAKATRAPVPRFRVSPRYAGPQDFVEQYVANTLAKVLGPTGFSSPDGSFRIDRLQPGPCRLTVEADGYPAVEVEPREVVSGRETDAGTIELPEGHVLAGVVVDPSGKPLVGAQLRLLSSDTEIDEGPEGIDRWFGEDDPVRADDTGAFRFPPQTPGTYTLLASAKGHVTRTLPKVDLRARSLEDLRVELRTGATLSVRVNDARGRALPSARLVFVHASGDLVHGNADAEGLARLEGARPGRWVVAFQGAAVGRLQRQPVKPEDRERLADLYRAIEGSGEALVLEGATAELVVRAPRLVHVRGRVALGTHKPVERGIGLYQEGAGVSSWGEFDAEGRFSLERVEPGAYVVILPTEDPERAGSYSGAGTVTIPDADEHDLDVPWPTGG